LQLLHNKVELGILSDKKESFSKQSIEQKATPPPNLLIKNHKIWLQCFWGAPEDQSGFM